MRRVVAFIAVVLGLANAGACAADDGGLVFDRSSVTSTMSADFHLSLGDPYTASFIKSRFRPFTVEFSDECEIECFVVSRGDVLFNVYGEDGGTISALSTWTNGTLDALGNRVGMPLREALKSDKGECEYAESMFCRSPIGGVLYFVGGDESCHWDVDWEKAPGTLVPIPACARLGGIELRQSR